MTPPHCFKSRSLILATVLVCGLGLFTHANAQRPAAFLVDLNSRSATVIDLGGTLVNPPYASEINEAGQVVGSYITADGNRHAFITGPDGMGMRDLGTLGGNASIAYGINDAGQVVGVSDTAEAGDARAFITGPNGMGMRDLGPAVGYGINDAGQVVGISFPNSHAFITGPDGMGMRDLGTLGDDPARSDSSAFDINNAGQVVGYSNWFRDGVGIFKSAFITGPNGIGMRDVGADGGVANGINEAGQVVGGYVTAGEYHAFITGPDGMGMRDLGTLGTHISEAYGINDVGQVVGEAYVTFESEIRTRAFITGPDGEDMVDLNSLVDLPDGVILTRADGINNNGQVIAVGVIPEPETYALMLAGLGLVGFMGRRKKAEDSHS